jgi:type II secretory pathway pseudopilin PulG
MESAATQPVRSMRSPPLKARALSIVEILVVMAIIAVVIAILLPVLSRAQASQRSVTCLSSLRQIAVAFQLYAHDNRGTLPDPASANLSWEQMLMRYYHRPFSCPADEELYPSIGSSYDWRDTGKETTTLAGRRITDVRRPETVLVFDALPGWHAKHKINVARIDGSAVSLRDEECLHDLAMPIRSGTHDEDGGKE